MSAAGKTILYTGAAGGLGLRSTQALLAKGARVVAVDHDPAKIAALIEAAGDDERLHLVAADMSDLDAFRAALTEASAATGGFDVVINNAAIYPSKPFDEFTVEEHQAVQRVNVDAGIVAVHLLVFLSLFFSVFITRLIRDSGIVLLTRIAGVLLSAIAVQLLANSVMGFIEAASTG